MKRRKFFKSLAAVSAACAVSPLVLAKESETIQQIAKRTGRNVIITAEYKRFSYVDLTSPNLDVENYQTPRTRFELIDGNVSLSFARDGICTTNDVEICNQFIRDGDLQKCLLALGFYRVFESCVSNCSKFTITGQ